MGVPPMHGRDGHATWLAAALFVLLVALSVIQLIPPSDTGTVVGWRFDQGIHNFPLNIVWRALVPVPPINGHFWNENFVGGNKRAAPLGMLLFPIVLIALRQHRIALALFAIGAGGILTFGFVKFYGSIRHHGHVYLVLVAALWLAAAVRPLCRRLSVVFTALLAVHVLAAVIALSIDWVRPFSQSRATAQHIRDLGLADAFLIGEKDTTTAPIAAYLDRRMYFPRGDRIGSFIIYDQRRLDFVSNRLPDICRAKAREVGGDVLLISTSRLPDGTPGFTPVGERAGCIVGDEDFFLYRVAP